LASFNVPHRFVASWIYELPFGPGKPFLNGKGKVIGHLLGGWQITGILDLEDGYSVTPSVSSNLSNTDGFTTLRPDRVCDGHLSSRNRDKWFETSCFPLPAPYRWGTAGRNIIQVPGITNFDGSIIKSFRVRESQRLEFRAEFFNAFNFTNLGAPVADAAAGPGTFGRIFSAGLAREIQFGLKYLF
jgi:hypothetical protein